MHYTSTVTSKGTITLPAAFRREHNIAPGSKVTLRQHGDKLVIDAPIDIQELRRRTQEHLRKMGITKPPTKAEIDASKIAYFKQKYFSGK